VAVEELRSLGILGGTFNPPHLGHLAIARQARTELGLDRVLLMPTYSIAHKNAGPDPGAEHRLSMCRLLVEDDGGLAASALEIERGGQSDRGGRSYTVDTLEEIHASHPDTRLTLIAGADTASTVPGWHEPARLLALADLAVARRSGTGARAVLDSLPRAAAVRFLDTPVLHVSSSIVRERLAAREPVEDLVGGAVAGYIAEHGLYRARTGALS